MHKDSRLGANRWAVLAAGALWALADAAAGQECWLDIYDQDNFQGEHWRVQGPAELSSLKAMGGQDWRNRIESLAVGKDAEVLAFRKESFEDEPQGPVNHPDAFQPRAWGRQDIPAYQEQEISFGPGKQERHLGELHFHRNINSLKVRCRS